MAVPFAGHLGLEITEHRRGRGIVRPARAPRADQPRRLPARRRPLHRRRDGLGRRLRRRLRRAHGRRHPARPQRRDRLRKDRQGPDRGQRQARRRPPPRPWPPSTPRARSSSPARSSLTDADGQPRRHRHRPLARPARTSPPSRSRLTTPPKSLESPPGPPSPNPAPVAQLDRASVYETEGHRFESCLARCSDPAWEAGLRGFGLGRGGRKGRWGNAWGNTRSERGRPQALRWVFRPPTFAATSSNSGPGGGGTPRGPAPKT